VSAITEGALPGFREVFGYLLMSSGKKGGGIRVSYYLELRIAIYVYCVSNILPTNVKLVGWTIENISVFTSKSIHQ
jgi:hypothetical protein